MQHRVLDAVAANSLARFERHELTNLITIVIPLRLSADRIYDETERLERIVEAVPSELFDMLIVDFGTPANRRNELTDLAERHPQVRIFRVEDTGPFNIGRARDIGAQHSKTGVIMFHDVDLIGSTETYRRIAAECESRRLSTNGYDFFCVPAIFLSPMGSAKYLEGFSQSPIAADRGAFDDAIRNAKAYVEHYATATSTLVINRHYYLCLGGHDSSYLGHGAEDFDFYHRAEAYAPRTPRPPRYLENIPLKNSGYNGFRAYFALFGLDVWLKGVALAHLHHPRREDVDPTYKKSQTNFALLRQRMTQFDASGEHLPPLGDATVGEKTLVLVAPGTIAADALRCALPALGDHDLIDETHIRDAIALRNLMAEGGYSQVLFLNPYANSHRMGLYKALRKEGSRTIAYERGALPDSWFFDRNGFLAHSTSYDNSHWDKPISVERMDRTKAWIQRLRYSTETLEKNGDRQGAEYWRRTLKIGSRRVIFVALQRPSDVATKWFGGPVGSASQFNEWIQFLASRIDKARFVLVVKKHPLESEQPNFAGAIHAPADAHVHDLIELADKTVVINSGVGLLSIMFGKPCLVCGEAFYRKDGLAVSASSPDELLELAEANLAVDEGRVTRFVAYLCDEFYSFGVSKYEIAKSKNGDTINRVRRTDFKRIVQLTPEPIILGEKPATWAEDSFVLAVAGYKKVVNPAKAVAPPGAPKVAPTPFPEWGRWKLAIHRMGQAALHPALSEEDRRRLRTNPIDFFKKAKWWPNRFFGRLLLDKSQRPY